jgi:catechol-2,3-dioxygenase
MSVERIGHVGLQAQNLELAVRFATDVLGLRESERLDGASYLTCNERHHELVLIEAERDGLDHIGLEVGTADDLSRLRSAIADRGLELSDAEPEPGIHDAVRFVAPGGIVFELFCGMTLDQPAEYATVGARPQRFGHATVLTSHGPELEDVLIGALGFRLTDRLPGVGAWLRCNADHHGIGMNFGAADGLHHYAFRQPDLSAIGRAGDLLARHERSFIWGPGRHGPGGNLFSYFPDTCGGLVEFYADLIEIVEEASYEPRVDWADAALNLWGPEPPPDFFEHLLAPAARP